jgi:hypothetical protein
VIKPESALQHIGSPPEFGVVLLLVTFALAVTPYLAGADFGAVKIPTFEKQPRLKKRLRFLGPLALALVLILHAPLFPQDPPPVTASVAPIKHDPTPTGTNGEVTHTNSSTVAPVTHSATDTSPANDSSAAATPSYQVTLLIPTSMSNAEVRVDGREATITSRTQLSINISVPASPGNRHIEISRDDAKPCKTTMAITTDTTLTPCS